MRSLPSARATILIALATVAGVLIVALRGGSGGVTDVGSGPGAAAEASEPAESGAKLTLDAAPEASIDRAEPTSRALPDGVWVRGRVVLPEGTPADEHVEVAARLLSFDDSPGYVAEIGGDGSFAVMFPKEIDSGWIEVHARYLVLEPNCQVDLEAPPEEVVIRPVLGGRVRGRLVAAGRPEAEVRALAGTSVEISASAKDGFRRFYPRKMSVGEDLSFEFLALPPLGSFELSARPNDYLPFEKGFEIPPGTITEIELELKVGARVSGRLVDSEGVPVGGGSVSTRVLLPSGEDSTGATPEAVSAADGSFALNAIQPGTVSIHIESRGSLDEVVEVGTLKDGDTRPGIEIRLQNSLVHGRVHWPDGTPAHDAVVEIGFAMETFTGSPPPLPNALWPVQGETFDGGLFEIEAAADASFCLVAHAPRQRDIDPDDSEAAAQSGFARVDGVRPSKNPIVVVLEPVPIVRGRVVDDLGDPITSFHVEGHQDQTWGTFSHSVQFAGEFEHPKGAFAMAGLTKSSWVFRASAEGRWSRPHSVRLEDRASPILLVIPRGSKVSGIVVDPDDHAVASAWIRSDSVVETHADEKGRFEITGLRPGRVELWASAPTFAPSEAVRLHSEPGGSITDVRLVLKRAGTIACEVLDAKGDPEPHCEIEMVTPARPRWVASDQGDGSALESDEEGKLVIENLAPGSYTLEKMLAGEKHQGRSRVSVDVVAGETVRVLLGGPSCPPIRIRGRVTDAGSPVVGWGVRTWVAQILLEEESVVRTDADGRFELVLPEPGDFEFSFDSEDEEESGDWPSLDSWRSLRAWRRIGGATTEQLEFHLPRGRISGVVVAGDGRPVEDVLVSIDSESTSSFVGNWTASARIQTSGAGLFTISNLPAGRYQLRAFSENTAEEDQPAAEIVLEEGRHAEGVVLRFK